MNRFAGLSVTEGRQEHFRLLREEAESIVKRSAVEPILEEINCPLGCSEQPELLFVKEGSSFVRCPRCRLVFINPQLVESALEEHFASSLAWEVWAETVLPSEEQQEFDRDKYRSALRTLKALHPKAQTLLDIGTGSGLFLSLAQEAGFRAEGIEPSQGACRVAQELYNLTLYNGCLADFPMEEGAYDIITFWASLEYHKYPAAALDKAAKLLAPNGLLLVFISGNSHSLVMRMLREKCVGFLFNRLWYFSPESLDVIVAKVSPEFQLVERYSMIPSLDVISRYLDYEDPYGSADRRLWSEDELGMMNNLIEKNYMGYKFSSLYRKAL